MKDLYCFLYIIAKIIYQKEGANRYKNIINRIGQKQLQKVQDRGNL